MTQPITAPTSWAVNMARGEDSVRYLRACSREQSCRALSGGRVGSSRERPGL